MHNLIIIPTYNEKDNIKLILNEISDNYPDFKILVVDDSSPDGTARVVEDLVQSNKNISLMLRKSKNGLGEAYKDALNRIKSDEDINYVFTMDADGSHDIKYIKSMAEALEDCDLVVGSRYVKGGGVENWEFWRKALSWGGNMYSRFITGAGISDLTAGFVGVRRKFLEQMDFSHLHSSGYAYQIEFKCYLVFRLRARVREVPIIFKSRRGGESKMSQQIIHEGVLTPLKILWKRKKK